MTRLRKSWLQQLVLAMICLVLVVACNNTSETSGAKTLKVAIDPTFAPFEFQKDGKLQGFDVDLINSIGKAAGFQPQYETMRFDAMIGSLQAGSVDAAVAGMTITAERAKTVDFSKPYFRSGLAIAISDKSKNISKLDDLKNKRVAVQIGTTSAKKAKTIPGVKISTFDTSDLALQELSNGNVDAVINDRPVTLYAFQTGNLKGLKVVGELLTEEYYGIALPKNSPNLALINQGLETIIKDGTYATIYKKWFNEEPAKLPDAAPLK
ncbi:MAG: basic amino acid ABC transporter substrate-binding protein [Coleofasciculaceae cyanobacterium]